MSLHVTTQNFTWYKSTFSLARQTARVFGAPTNPHEIIYCHILFSSCFIYESFVSQIKTISFFRANQTAFFFSISQQLPQCWATELLGKCSCNRTGPFIIVISVLWSTAEWTECCGAVSFYTLSCFCDHHARRRQVRSLHLFNQCCSCQDYQQRPQSMPVQVVSFITHEYLSPGDWTQNPTPDSSLFVCTWRKTNDQSFM